MCAYIGKYQKANEELRKFIQYKKAKQQGHNNEKNTFYTFRIINTTLWW